MSDRGRLEETLRGMDGAPYGAYRTLEGEWDLEAFTLRIDHVQRDPFASPSRVRLILEPEQAQLPETSYETEPRRWGTSALLATSFARRANEKSAKRGTGRSGEIRMADPGQLLVAQTAVQITVDGAVDARCTVGLPGNGRRVAGHDAVALLLRDVATLVHRTLVGRAHDEDDYELWAATSEDAEAARRELDRLGLVAFVADGAVLPRRSGVDDRPLEAAKVVPFSSPPSMRVNITLPNGGSATGMGIREGVTLIVGGGFHGKSTLLGAIQAGVWNHAPGDGRELVITRSTAQKVRAEDGRPVTGVDISCFINGLPQSRGTRDFTTGDASGSTSQAAAIMESIEAGADVMLIDEDTSATNFMIRDRRMQELVPGHGEPITPFIDRVRELHDEWGVSTVMVVGGSGDYLEVADTIVRMEAYSAQDVTAKAEAVTKEFPTNRLGQEAPPLTRARVRQVRRASLNAKKGKRDHHVRPLDDRSLQYGRGVVDLVAVEQLMSRQQIRAAGLSVALLSSGSGAATVEELLDELFDRLDTQGLDVLDSRLSGDLADIRPLDVAALLNRLRDLRVD